MYVLEIKYDNAKDYERGYCGPCYCDHGDFHSRDFS
jgi:hypothetical protein